MRVGGPARYFCVAKNIDEIKQALVFAENNHLPVFILGGGSNIVMSDEGFSGLVLKPSIPGVNIIENDSGYIISLGAGKCGIHVLKKLFQKIFFEFKIFLQFLERLGPLPFKILGHMA